MVANPDGPSRVLAVLESDLLTALAIQAGAWEAWPVDDGPEVPSEGAPSTLEPAPHSMTLAVTMSIVIHLLCM